MFQKSNTNMIFAILVSFFVAMVLSVINYPNWMQYTRPDWVLLVLVYWCIAAPQRVGVASGFLIGLITDILYYSLLGQHAIAKTIVAWLAAISSKKLSIAPLWFHCVFILFVASIDIAIIISINLLLNGGNATLVYWQPTVVTCITWLFFYLVLQHTTQRL